MRSFTRRLHTRTGERRRDSVELCAWTPWLLARLVTVERRLLPYGRWGPYRPQWGVGAVVVYVLGVPVWKRTVQGPHPVCPGGP